MVILAEASILQYANPANLYVLYSTIRLVSNQSEDWLRQFRGDQNSDAGVQTGDRFFGVVQVH